MAITPVWIEGYEHGAWSAAGAGIINTLGNRTAVSSAVARTGTYSLKVETTAQDGYFTKNTSGSPAVLVMSFYVYYDDLPNADSMIYIANIASGQTARLYWESTDSKLYMAFGTTRTANGSIALSADTWHRIDVKIDYSANPTTYDLSVDGNAVAQHTYEQAATTINNVQMGTLSSVTTLLYIDDMIWSYTAADYTELQAADHYVKGIVPTSDGTHSIASSAIKDDDGNVIHATNFPAYALLDELPVTADSDYVVQDVIEADSYAEVNFADISETNILAAAALTCANCSADGTSNSYRRVVDAADQVTQVGTTDILTAALKYDAAIITTPVAGWSQTSVNGLKFRFGWSNDVTPNPRLQAVIVQYAYGDASTDAEVALTGVSGTASVGAVALSAALALAGLAGTAAVGTLGPDVAVPISGIEAQSAVDSMSPMRAAVLAGIEAVDAAGGVAVDVTIPITGNEATGIAYTLTWNGSCSVGDVAPASGIPLSGTEATGAVGTVVAAIGVGPDITIPITGVSANPSYPLSGVAATGGVGTVSPVETGDILMPLTGVLGTGAVGDVTYLTMGGEGMTGEVGDVGPALAPPLTGVEATGAVGSLGQDRSAGLTGTSATGVAGGWRGFARPLTGTAGTASVGTLTPASSKATTGVAATSACGSLVQSHGVALTGTPATGVAGYMDTLVAGDVVRPLTGVAATAHVGTLTCGTATPQYIHVKPRLRIIEVSPRKRIITVSRRRF